MPLFFPLSAFLGQIRWDGLYVACPSGSIESIDQLVDEVSLSYMIYQLP